MLIDIRTVKKLLDDEGILVKGILHVGAHECEEKQSYNTTLNIEDSKILWLDANPRLTEKNKQRGIPNNYTAVLDEKERDTTFKITNNGQSSSILDLGTHKYDYPDIHVVETLQVRTQTLEQFFNRNAIDPKLYNFWNFDIQGAEVQVFRGSKGMLKYADAIYAEVNTDNVYDGCGRLDEMDAILAEAGLTRVMIHMTGAKWGDALYIRKA